MQPKLTPDVLLAVIKQNPGLTTRGVRIRAGGSATMDARVRERLLRMEAAGQVRREDTLSGGLLQARRWWPT